MMTSEFPCSIGIKQTWWTWLAMCLSVTVVHRQWIARPRLPIERTFTIRAKVNVDARGNRCSDLLIGLAVSSAHTANNGSCDFLDLSVGSNIQ